MAEDVHPNHVIMGSHIRLRRGTVLFGSEAHPLRLGDDVFVSVNCFIQGGAEQVTIGSRVTLAAGVCIHSDSGPNTSPLLQSAFPIVAAPVTIEDDVWIGDYATIMPGVTIGHGSVIGAHAFVRASVPPHSVVGGQPARRLRSLDDHKRACHACSLSGS